MSTDFFTPVRFNHCLHRNITVEATGFRSFQEGEVCDNIQERILCLDCLEYLTEAEIRASWSGSSCCDEDNFDFC